MNKKIIVYKSSTGFTEKYAEFLSAALDCEAVGLKKVTADRLNGYETVIFGTRIHAGFIDGLKKIKKLFSSCGAKDMIIFVTGGTPADAAEIIDKLWQDNLTAEEQRTIPHFYLPGGLCYERMSLPDRMIMRLAAKMMSTAENADSVQAGFAQAITGSYDISDEKYIAPIVDYLTGRGKTENEI